MTKELNVHMSIYMHYEGNRTKEELEEKFQTMLERFIEENKLDFQIYDTELQEI